MQGLFPQEEWKQSTCLQENNTPENPGEEDPQSWMCWQDLNLFQTSLNA